MILILIFLDYSRKNKDVKSVRKHVSVHQISGEQYETQKREFLEILNQNSSDHKTSTDAVSAHEPVLS